MACCLAGGDRESGPERQHIQRSLDCGASNVHSAAWRKLERSSETKKLVMQPERDKEGYERSPDGRTMKTASEYRGHAQGGEVLAQQVLVCEPCEQFLNGARTWEASARTREGLVSAQAFRTQ